MSTRGRNWHRNHKQRLERLQAEYFRGLSYRAAVEMMRLGWIVAHLQRRIRSLKKVSRARAQALRALRPELAVLRHERWRRFADELPPDGEEVLICRSPISSLVIGHRCGDGYILGCTESVWFNASDLADAYWRPQPAPPTDEPAEEGRSS